MRLDDILSAPYLIGCTVGILVGYAWHRWSLYPEATLADTIVLAVASEAFILLWSILILGRWRKLPSGREDHHEDE